VFFIIACAVLHLRTRLQHRRRSQQPEMLLDQSVMWLRKATDWWCDSGGWISV